MSRTSFSESISAPRQVPMPFAVRGARHLLDESPRGAVFVRNARGKIVYEKWMDSNLKVRIENNEAAWHAEMLRMRAEAVRTVRKAGLR